MNATMNVVGSEALKARTGRFLWVLLLAGIGLSGLTSFGWSTDAYGEDAAAAVDTAALTSEIVRSWMMMFLFAALAGAVFVTRDYATGTVARAAIVSGSRDTLFGAKIAVGLVIGAIFGTVATVLSVVSPSLSMAIYDATPVFTSDTWYTAAGVFACSLLAGAFGVLVGWLVRNQVVAIVILVVVTLAVDPALQRLIPDFARYLVTIAMSSLYRDGKPELLSIPVAAAVLLGWLAVLGFCARTSFRSRDIT
ncbi:hypothetical protein CH294_10825 [Rhodococcus sp. 14-2483-1-1]|uniref:ABC transporter permease n=1 Tax=Rhodococcus sp. 14-2483-1-1 TaxID=2023148 RepID=UPI000B9A56ED|nr:ABC transporter permease [Rhodococcus sp. 14-2483-1-1]OZF36874.1 hypothetical protein CH294_10825 [Rhodococcus sp. 14-2483-1-1]